MLSAEVAVFRPALAFLADLAEHNDKAWFEANRSRYERDVKEPAEAFVEAVAPRVAALSPRFRAVARGRGTSVGRLHRDTRFSADKSPYKDWLGIHVKHDAEGGPGLYLRISAAETGVGLGVWELEPARLAAVRARVAAADGGWADVRRALDAGGFGFIGESLKRVPAGFPADHPFAEDLRRKHFGAGRSVDPGLPMPAFVDAVAAAWTEGWPLVGFLCEALDLEA